MSALIVNFGHGHADCTSFNIKLNNIDWVSNYEKTRWFLVLRVQKPENNALNHLLRASNRSLTLFNQPPLYEAPASAASKPDRRRQSRNRDEQPKIEDHSHCFHISLAWSLTEPTPDVKDRTARMDLRRLGDLAVHFDSVKAKIGNTVSSIPLSTGVHDERTIGGL